MQRENKNVLDWRLPRDVVSDAGPGMWCSIDWPAVTDVSAESCQLIAARPVETSDDICYQTWQNTPRDTSVTNGVVNRPVAWAPLHKDSRVWDRATDLTPAAARDPALSIVYEAKWNSCRWKGGEEKMLYPLICKQRSSKVSSPFVAMIEYSDTSANEWPC